MVLVNIPETNKCNNFARGLIVVLLEFYFFYFLRPDNLPYLRVQGVSGGQVGLLRAEVPATDQRVGVAQVRVTADILCCRGRI